jgi:anthranilate/para-aminobenzoate synthase component I
MKLCAIETSLPADVLELARRVWRAPTPCLLWSRSGDRPSYLACDAVEEANSTDPEPDLPFDAALGPFASVPRWVGVLPYEAERARLERPGFTAAEQRPAPLIERTWWWRYQAVAVIEKARVVVVGESEAAASALAHRLSTAAPDSLSCELSVTGALDERAHEARIRRALEHIHAGDVYAINLAHRLELSVMGTALALLSRISAWAPNEYCSAMVLPDGSEVVSTSPELCLRLEADRRVWTVPIKGTRVLRDDDSAWVQLERELDADPKERAELAMIVDVERNDLGKIAEIGSVFAWPAQVTRHGRVLHRQAKVSARLRADVSRSELLHAVLPSGSVTGAPKRRAMELIAHLEAERRGLYTGAFGYVDHSGGLQLAMAIRTLSRRGDVAHYPVGGGIVIDSDPAREVQETRWKALQIERALSEGPGIG